MSPEEKEYTSYRVVRGAESLDEAKLLLEAGHLSTAVNASTMPPSTPSLHCS